MKFKNYKLANKWLYSVTIFTLSFLLPMKVFAVDIFTKYIGGFLWDFWMAPLIFALELEVGLLKIVASYNNFTSEGGVILGWIALRDLSNMFFILILLVIAFATILRISSYGYQQLLKRTIIIAILINFSKTIVGFLIDVVQVVMLTFISAVDDILTGGLMVALGIHKISNISLTDGIDYFDFIIGLIMAAVFVAILVVVLGVMVMMLMMRIVALWVAIVLAPLAFLASIFPATNSFYNTWIKQLGANLVTGPMLAFFLWLTFSIVGNGNAYTTFTDSTTQGPTEFLGTTNMVNYIIAISLLLMGIKMAASSGAAGASIASKGMDKIKSTAGHIARRYPMALGQRIGSFVAGGLIDKDGKAKGLKNLANTKFGKALKLNKFGDVYSAKRKTLQASDKKGARFVGGIMNQKWQKVPFYGGRIQRAAQQMQGINVSRIQAEKSEDEKNLLPQHKVAFQATYGEGASEKKGLAKLYSRVGSWGGDKEREGMMYQNMSSRGEITSEHAEKATDAFRSMGLEDEMQKVQAEYGTYATKEEAIRLIKKLGNLAGVISNLKSNSFYEGKFDKDGNFKADTDKDGNKIVKKSMDNLVDAIADSSHGYSDHNAISAATLKMDKVDRWAFNDVMRDRVNRKDSFNGQVIDEGKDGVEFDKRGALTTYLDNEDVTRAIALGQTYVQKTAVQVDEKGNITNIGSANKFWLAATKQLEKARIASGNIGDAMPDLQGVDGVEMEERRRIARDLDRIDKDTTIGELPNYLKERFGKDKKDEEKLDFEKFDDFRQGMYKQVTDMQAWTLGVEKDEKGIEHLKERVDYGDQSHIFDNDKIGKGLSSEKQREAQMRMYALMHADIGIARSDILLQKDTLAKENEEGYKARQDMFAQAADPKEAERKYEATMKELRRIESIRGSKAGEEIVEQYSTVDKDGNVDKITGKEALEQVIRKMSAEQVGDKRKMYDVATRSFNTELTDGAHGTRFMEANISNVYEATQLRHALERSENQQQAQAFSVAVGDQTPFLLNTLAELGKLPQKVLMDNSSKGEAAIAMQKYRDINHFQSEKGILPQDLSVLGSNLKYLASVIKHAATSQGYAGKPDAKGNYSSAAIAKGAMEYLNAKENIKLKEKMDALEKIFDEKIDYSKSSPYDDRVQDGDYNPKTLAEDRKKS